ncbi:RecX family transcriptional regulator [Candidatus Gracilibacteria bacterium]|nr:RecX family transcriptional regulator [Candidatus Gracilibacteria bacterium]
MNISLRLSNYISRYAPSRKRVTAYLEKKNCQNPAQLLADNGYDESLMVDMWMRSFVSLGKGKREMSTKLMKKEFPKEIILEKIEAFDTEIHDWESNKTSVINQIQTLEQRGKSRRIISTLLNSRYSYFRDEITELLVEKNDTNNLQKEVQKYRNRYNTVDKKIREKMIASLLRKGFSYTDIKKAIAVDDE